MLKKTLLFFVCSFVCAQLFAQGQTIQFEKYTLPNGLKVILHEDHSAPVVAVTALYHVGSKNEDTARTGFAHFFEHLLFEGSENIKRGEFDKYVTNAGGELNANTTQDRTFYYELLPSNQLDLGLWLESERMMHAKIEQVGVNTQREVVKEEKRMRMDNRPYGSFLTEMLKRAFKVHPYRWAPIGSMDHLNAAKLEEFIQFYKTYYVPNNCVLSIAGDFNKADLKNKIEAYFATIPKGTYPIKKPNVKEPALGGEVRDVIYDNVQLEGVFQAYRAPKQTAEEFYAFKVLATILAGGESSRMNKVLVDSKQLAAAAQAVPFFNEDEGLFITLAIANAGVKAKLLEQNMDSVVNELKTNLVGEREFQKVKNQITTELVKSKSTMAGIAEDLANFEVYFGDANLVNTELEKYNKVTREDVLKVAKKYLNNDNRVVLYYVPKSQAPTK
jgi:predicted Zn-dependent peptidase